MLFGNTGNEDNSFPFEISETCPFATFLDNPEGLAALRDFRDKVLSQHVSGVVFTFLFYRNAPELTRLLSQHKGLQEEVKSIVSDYSALLNDLSNGETAYLLDDDRVRIISLLKSRNLTGVPHLHLSNKSWAKQKRVERLKCQDHFHYLICIPRKKLTQKNRYCLTKIDLRQKSFFVVYYSHAYERCREVNENTLLPRSILMALY